MSAVDQIEAAANQLPKAQFRELLRRLRERAADAWDRQIAEDAEAGRLDFLLKELDEDIATGRTKLIDEVCRQPKILGKLPEAAS